MPAAVMPPGVAAAAVTAAGSPSRAMIAAAPCTPATASRRATSGARPCGLARPGEALHDRGQHAGHAAGDRRGDVELRSETSTTSPAAANSPATSAVASPRVPGTKQEDAQSQRGGDVGHHPAPRGCPAAAPPAAARASRLPPPTPADAARATGLWLQAQARRAEAARRRAARRSPRRARRWSSRPARRSPPPSRRRGPCRHRERGVAAVRQALAGSSPRPGLARCARRR